LEKRKRKEEVKNEVINVRNRGETERGKKHKKQADKKKFKKRGK